MRNAKKACQTSTIHVFGVQIASKIKNIQGAARCSIRFFAFLPLRFIHVSAAPSLRVRQVCHAFCRLRELSPRQPFLSCKQLHSLSARLPGFLASAWQKSFQLISVACSPPAAHFSARLRGRSGCGKAARYIVFQTKARSLALCCPPRCIDQSPSGIFI